MIWANHFSGRVKGARMSGNQGEPKAREKNRAHLPIGRGNIIWKQENQHSAHQNQYKMALLWISMWFSITTDTMKPLARECRYGKYNFRFVPVILLYEHISFMVWIEGLHETLQFFVLHLSMCDFDNQRKCRGHAGYPRISSNNPISPVYKYNFPLLNKHCWRYIIKLIR